MRVPEFIKGTFKDKRQSPSGREATVLIFVCVVIASWIGEQFFDKHVPEFMFLGFIGVITAGIGLYTVEKPMNENEKNNTNTISDENNKQQNNTNPSVDEKQF
jgi:cadmium resistance protein CadD (predicted permease)